MVQFLSEILGAVVLRALRLVCVTQDSPHDDTDDIQHPGCMKEEKSLLRHR